jgi:hypothetical protein
MENISRGPTFGDFVTIHTRTSQLQDHRVKEYRLPSPPLLNAMYCVRIFLWTVKYSLRNTKVKGVGGNLCIFLLRTKE